MTEEVRLLLEAYAVAQVAFHYNKDNTLSKRYPYTVMGLTQKEEIQHGN